MIAFTFVLVVLLIVLIITVMSVPTKSAMYVSHRQKPVNDVNDVSNASEEDIVGSSYTCNKIKDPVDECDMDYNYCLDTYTSCSECNEFKTQCRGW